MKKTTIKNLFRKQPSTQGELKQFLSQLDIPKAQEDIADMIEQGILDDMDYGLFINVITEIGIGDQRERLLNIVNDEENDPLISKFALTALSDENPDELAKELGNVDPVRLQEACDMPLSQMMTEIQMDPSTASELTEFLEESPKEMQEFLLYQLGRCRREVGTSAVAAYAHALGSNGLAPLYQLMIDAVVKEGGKDGVKLLTKLRDNAESDEIRRQFQAALLRTETRNIEENQHSRSPMGTAYVGTCDGEGAFLVLGRFRVSKKNTTTASLCIRAAGEIRDGFVLPRSDEREFQELLNSAKEKALTDFVEVSIDEAATLVDEAITRHKALGGSVSKDSEPATKLFRRARCVQLPDIEVPESNKRVSINRIRNLLERPIYTYWFFDIGDLMSCGIEAPDSQEVSKRWLAQAGAKIAGTPIQERVVAMLRHMTRWHTWNREDDLSVLCAEAAVEAESGLQSSAILKVILEKTLQGGAVADQIEMFSSEIEEFGDTELRQNLKERFFAELKRPRGRHLASLDLTEAAYSSFGSALAILPSERRPRNDDLYEMAFVVSKTFLDIVLKNKTGEAEIQKLIERVAKKGRLSIDESKQILALVLPKITAFIDDVCGECHIDCLNRPNAKMNDEFFSDAHPMGEDDEDDFLEMDDSFEEDDDLICEEDDDVEPNWNKAHQLALEAVQKKEPKIGRNDPCPCGSGKKYKKCCML